MSLGIQRATGNGISARDLQHGSGTNRPQHRPAPGSTPVSRESVLTETGKIELEVPRDRLSTFDPQLIAKYQRRFPGFDEKIISMYARGMSVREIQGHLRDLYGVDVFADLVSAVTDAVLEEIAWSEVIPFYAFPDEVRRIIYTTNAIESLNAKLRRAVRARGHFPTDESALKLLFLVLNLAQKEWRMPPREWAMAKAQFAIIFEGRFKLA